MLLVAICILVAGIYWYGTKDHDYWKNKGVKYDKPLPFFGNAFRFFTQKESLSQFFEKFYLKYPNEKFVGIYFGGKKMLIVRDPELTKVMLVSDSTYFHKRGLNPHDTVLEPILQNLVFAEGDLWKSLRQKLTPAFTTAKVKAAFHLIVESALKLQEFANRAAKTGVALDVRDLMARYTMDFIGVYGFGLEMDYLDDENSILRKLGKRIFTYTLRDIMRITLKFVIPETFKNLHMMAPEIERATLHLFKAVAEKRNYTPSERNDFIDILLALNRKDKSVKTCYKSNGRRTDADIELNDSLMAAQVFLFFAAGFETSSSATSYTLHQLAFHPEEQRKVQEEIDEVLLRYDNKLCYDAIKEMRYLEMVFLESMRLFPSIGFLIRKCVMKYNLPGSNVTIDEGIMVVIPIQALHMDEKYFEAPGRFMPERFSPDRINDTKKYVYLPFGEGPRSCIGRSLGLTQSLAGLAALLHKFSVEPAPTSLRHPVSDPSAIITQDIKGGLPLHIRERI